MMYRSSATSRNAPAGSGSRRAAGRAGLLSLCLTAAAAAGLSTLAARTDPGDAPAVEASLDQERVAVGERFSLAVVVRHDASLEWEARSIGARLGPFDVEQVAGPESLPPRGAPREEGVPEGPGTRWVFRLAAFELGTLTVPPLRLRYRTPGGESEYAFVETPEMTVEVVTTLAGPEEEPADIRHGFTLPRGYGAWIGLGAAVVALAAGAIWAIRRRLRRRAAAAGEGPAAPAAPIPPPYDRYREALEELLRAGLLESGRIKEFHVRIAEIVKRYIGETLRFDAVDRTTQEVMADLQAGAAPERLRDATGRFLDACDRVKFAKHLPEGEEQERTVQGAWKILEIARPQPPKPEGADASPAGGAAS